MAQVFVLNYDLSDFMIGYDFFLNEDSSDFRISRILF